MKRYILSVAIVLLLPSFSAKAACNNNLPSTSNGVRFIDNGSTVTDIQTGLMWAKCLLGQTGDNCDSGSAATYNWQSALTQSQQTQLTYSDWRLPNIKELQSLVDESCSNPAMNTAIFPTGNVGTGANQVWSSTPYAGNPVNARGMSYSLGQDNNLSKNTQLYVRLVRDNTPIYRQLVDSRSNKCMEVLNGTMSNGTNVQLNACSASHDGRQGWWYHPLQKRFHNQKNPDFCLDHEGGASNGGIVKIWSCADSQNQRWDWDGNSIRNRVNHNFAIDASGTGNGSNIRQFTASGANNQQWFWLSPINALVDSRSGRCIDVAGGSFANGTNLQLYDCVSNFNHPNMQWFYNHNTQQIVSGTNYNFCMDNTGTVGNNQNIYLWTCDATNTNQKFIWKGNSIRIFNNTNIAIDAFGTGNGANVGQFTQNGQAQQSWRFVQ